MKSIIKKIMKYLSDEHHHDRYQIVEHDDGIMMQQTMDATKPVSRFDGKVEYRQVGDYDFIPYWIESKIDLTPEEREEYQDSIQWVDVPQDQWKWSDFLFFSKHDDHIKVIGGGYCGSYLTDHEWGGSLADEFENKLTEMFPNKTVYGCSSEQTVYIGNENFQY
tara:strand:+ start:384 stop:875 length:492 start_codon:yes stop_codon:yes gene_type:complete